MIASQKRIELMTEKKAIYKSTLRNFVVLCVVYLGYRLIAAPPNNHNNFNNYNQIKTLSIDEQLKRAADSVNKSSHLWIDSLTEFVNVDVLANKTFQYNFALRIDTNKYNMKVLKELNEKNLYNTFISSPSFKIFKDNDVTIIYRYTDIENNFLYQIIFTPDKYNK